MTGIAGGTVEDGQLTEMVAELEQEAWYDADRATAGEFGVSLQHHGEKDPLGATFWENGESAGVIDGAITNRAELGWNDEEIFDRLCRSPEATLRALEGPFTIACIDASDDRVILATDKIGCRTPYYTTGDGFTFASGLSPILPTLDDPTVDEQGVSDLLLMGNMWSDTTLLEGVKALHPATVIEYRDGEITENRYWQPDFTPAEPTAEYRHELTNAFQKTVDRTASSVSGDVGLWLSGGLDSRATANELARAADDESIDTMTTYTYDANPSGGVNPRLAAKTADALDLPNDTVPLTVERFVPMLEKAVAASDGMVKWNTLLNLTAVYNLEAEDADPDILMEGHEGALVGHHLCRHHLTEPSSLVESMYESEAALSTDDVESLMSVSVDPLASFRKEARRTDEPTLEEGAVDIHFQNYYSRLAHASNHVPRGQVGTRVPYADGPFLEHVAKLPLSWRMGALPFSDGKLVYGVVEPKIRMIRALNTDLAEIPYERSRLKPSVPYPFHVAGFYAATAISQLLSKPTYGGGGSMTGSWYDSHEGFREKIDALLESVAERSFIDGDTVATYQEQLEGDDPANMNVVSALTTLEIWLQQNMD